MAEARTQRQLAAILAADVVGYSRLMERAELDTFTRLRALHRELFEPEIRKHNGRVFKLMGDGLLAVFGSVVDAVECAVVLQQQLGARNEGVANDQRIDVRVGITLGDVILDDEDCYGEGVNIAARLQQLAPPREICVSQTVVDHLGSKLQIGFEDLGDQQVKNIAKPIRAWQVLLNGAPSVPANRGTLRQRKRWTVPAVIATVLFLGGALFYVYPLLTTSPLTAAGGAAVAQSPALAVLPFSNMSGDQSLNYFADGVTETLTAGLSRSPVVRVVARTSAAAYKGKALDVRQIGRELGARYLLEGSVQKGTDRVRIVAQLIDTTSGDHVWADRYEGEGTDVLALQDQITEKVIGSVAGVHGLIRKKEYEQAWGKDQASLDEYDYFLRAHQLMVKLTKEDTHRALPILQEGLQKTPNSPLLLIWTGWWHFQLVFMGWSDDPAADLKRAYDLTLQAFSAKDISPMAKFEGHRLKASLEIYHKNDWDQAWRERDIVLALNPYDAASVAVMAELAVQAGKADEAIASLMKEGISWDSTYLFTSLPFHLGMAYFIKGEYDTALLHLTQEPNLDPLYTLLFLAATYAELGRLDDARSTVEKIRAGNPDTSIELVRSVWVFRHQSDNERLLGALRKAGLPEDARW